MRERWRPRGRSLPEAREHCHRTCLVQGSAEERGFSGGPIPRLSCWRAGNVPRRLGLIDGLEAAGPSLHEAGRGDSRTGEGCCCCGVGQGAEKAAFRGSGQDQGAGERKRAAESQACGGRELSVGESQSTLLQLAVSARAYDTIHISLLRGAMFQTDLTP